MNPFRKARPLATNSKPATRQPQPLFDELEQRLLLSVFFGEDFPDLSDMENTNNIIVRFNMNVMSDSGRSYFDLELFVSEDDDPVGTVANFVDYVQRGQYDGMFFQWVMCAAVFAWLRLGLWECHPLPPSPRRRRMSKRTTTLRRMHALHLPP